LHSASDLCSEYSPHIPVHIINQFLDRLPHLHHILPTSTPPPLPQRARRSSRRDIEPAVAGKISNRLIITHTLHSASHNINVVEREITARSRTAQDIVVLRARRGGARDVGHGDVANEHAIRWDACWAAVEVVLLDVDAVLADVRYEDVFVDDSAD